jgi:hypothetical protein
MESQDALDTPEMIDRIVASWLKKRGFVKIERMFRAEQNLHSIDEFAAESAALHQSSIQNMILFYESVDDVVRYTESFSSLKEWVDASLDRYKTELMAVLYPLFVHCVLDMLEKGHVQEAGAFLSKYKAYAGDHVEVLNKLKALHAVATNTGDASLQKIGETPEYAELRGRKMSVSLSAYAFRLLFTYLLESKYMTMLAILNAHVDVKVVSAVPDVDGHDLRFFEASAPSKPIMWGRLGTWIPRPLGESGERDGGSKRAKGGNEGELDGHVQVKSEVPLPPGLPLSVVAAQEEDALVAAARAGKSLPR